MISVIISLLVYMVIRLTSHQIINTKFEQKQFLLKFAITKFL